MKSHRSILSLQTANIILLILLISLVISIILLCSVPPTSRDALTHHLFIPKLYIAHGGIYQIPEFSWSYYPMNLDLLYMAPLYFGNDIIPKYIHFFFALMTAVLVYRYLKKKCGTQYGLLGALFFLSIPIIVKLSITVYVDLGVIFFTTASLLLLLHWAEKNFQTRFLILAGLCCGLAAGTKYNGIISIVLLTLFIPLIYQQSATVGKKNDRKALFYGLLFATTALTMFSPWLIRNYVWTGNPIYPLHNSFFQKVKGGEINKQAVEENENIESLQRRPTESGNEFITRKILYHEKWWQALLLPIRVFYEGRDDNPQFFDGKLSPFLLFLPLLAFLFKSTNLQRRREEKFLLIFAILYFFLAFFQSAFRIRYMVPVIPPLVILSMSGLHRTFKHLFARIRPGALQKTLIVFLATGIPSLMLWYNADYISHQFALIKTIPYLRGTISRDQYITAFRPEYPAILHANTHLSPNTKVLCIFLGNRGYYMNFQPIFEAPVTDKLLSTFLDRDICDQHIYDDLLKKNITHILIRDDLTTSWFQRLTNQEKTCIAPLLSNASKPLFSQNGYTFFRVR